MSADEEDASYKKNFVRGVITNTGGLTILYLVTLIGPTLWRPVIIALGIQLAVFFFHGLPNSSEKFYDLSGSFTHFAVVLASMMTCPGGASPMQVLYGLLSTLWMVRLGTFLFLRILRDGKDPRFDEVKKVKIRFLGAWTLQAVWVVLVQLPVILVSMVEDTAPAAVYVLNAVVLAAWAAAFMLEVVADVQKFSFRQDPANRHKFITTGIFQYAQYPNYCGEIAMWCAAAAGASLFGLFTGNVVMLFAWLSPLFTAFLLLKFMGVPALKAAGEKKWGSDPQYRHYVDNTSMLIPWTPPEPLAGYEQLY